MHYEWLPAKCRNCKGYGHVVAECRHNKKQVWVPKEKSAPVPIVNTGDAATVVNNVSTEPVAAQGEPDQEWTQVTRKRTKNKRANPPTENQGRGSNEGTSSSTVVVGDVNKRAEVELVEKGSLPSSQ